MRYLENKKSKRVLFCGAHACNEKHIINFFDLNEESVNKCLRDVNGLASLVEVRGKDGVKFDIF